MGRIVLLDNALANMIAAGEVIERPSSVIKELVENSVDAGSTRIEVAISEAGRASIVVSDNGSGMDRDDAILAFKRHATSKILNEFDLFRIKTLGFRGEALPSIAAVAHVTMLTAPATGPGSAITAYEDVIEATDAPGKKGTMVTVSELFYNTPARLKYLKSDASENASSIETMSRMALAHPAIAFSFSIDGRLIFETSGRGQLLEALLQVYGAYAAKNMVPVSYSCPDFSISGYIGKPDIAKSSRYYIMTFLNGRSVYMPKIQTSIIEAYRDFLPPVRFPFVSLCFQVDPSLVDVNVHPSKREIRFSKEEELKVALLKIIPIALKSQDLTAAPLARATDIYQVPSADPDIVAMSLFEQDDTNAAPSIEKKQDAPSFPDLIAVGQLHDTYIVASRSDGGYVLIDQHAAAERLNYEKYRSLALADQHRVAPLVPLIIELKPSDDALLNDDKLALLHDVGVGLEPFGNHAYRVTEIPLWARESDERTYVEQLIEDVLRDDKTDILTVRDHAIASKSCKRSLKANQKLSLLEMQALIDKLLQADNPYACPHGRPTMIAFSKFELEKMFNRTGF